MLSTTRENTTESKTRINRRIRVNPRGDGGGGEWSGVGVWGDGEGGKGRGGGGDGGGGEKGTGGVGGVCVEGMEVVVVVRTCGMTHVPSIRASACIQFGWQVTWESNSQRPRHPFAALIAGVNTGPVPVHKAPTKRPCFNVLQLWDLDRPLTDCTRGNCWTCTPGRRTPCQ